MIIGWPGSPCRKVTITSSPALNLLWRGQAVAAGFVGKGEGQGERIGGVGGGWFGKLQHALDHFGDGEFLRGSVTDDGLFYFSRRDFEDFEASFGGGGEAGSAGLAHDQGRLQILRKEEAFDRAG